MLSFGGSSHPHHHNPATIEADEDDEDDDDKDVFYNVPGEEEGDTERETEDDSPTATNATNATVEEDLTTDFPSGNRNIVPLLIFGLEGLRIVPPPSDLLDVVNGDAELAAFLGSRELRDPFNYLNPPRDLYRIRNPYQFLKWIFSVIVWALHTTVRKLAEAVRHERRVYKSNLDLIRGEEHQNAIKSYRVANSSRRRSKRSVKGEALDKATKTNNRTASTHSGSLGARRHPYSLAEQLSAAELMKGLENEEVDWKASDEVGGDSETRATRSERVKVLDLSTPAYLKDVPARGFPVSSILDRILALNSRRRRPREGEGGKIAQISLVRRDRFRFGARDFAYYVEVTASSSSVGGTGEQPATTHYPLKFVHLDSVTSRRFITVCDEDAVRQLML